MVTGGGPGVMEAGNRGAADAGAPSIGLNIMLPHEQAPNRYVTPELSFNFHYFAIRKMHFMMRAKAVVVFPGGFGTLDEMFEVLTLIQTKRMERMPLILFSEAFWRGIINFGALAEFGTIAPDDLSLINFVETAEEAWKIISDFYDTENKEPAPWGRGGFFGRLPELVPRGRRTRGAVRQVVDGNGSVLVGVHAGEQLVGCGDGFSLGDLAVPVFIDHAEHALTHHLAAMRAFRAGILATPAMAALAIPIALSAPC